jgi:alkanesulfonate monooxygenase SsuD/methylene tetrahydromethanopterin reductase-like flavin-dependent oxidoreductase (luciferase family)
MFPHAIQEPHPPIFLAGATERSITVAGRMGFGLLLSSWTPFDTLAKHIAMYRRATDETPADLRANPARGHVDVTRYVYVADTDAKARQESEAVILRHLKHFSSGHTSGYLGTVSAGRTDYEGLSRDVILHGSPATVIAKIEHLRSIGVNSLMLHYPPWYGSDRAIAALERFAAEVMPKFGSATAFERQARAATV